MPMPELTALSVTLWEQIVSHLPGEHLGSLRCVCQTSRQAVENYVQQVVITKKSIDAAPDLSRWPNLQTIIITDNMKAPYPEMMSLGPQVIVVCKDFALLSCFAHGSPGRPLFKSQLRESV